MDDLYETLGVRSDASADEIRRAWRSIAATCHPDLCPDDPSALGRFQDLAAAYQVLRDPVQRRLYDQNRRRGSGTDAASGGLSSRLRDAFWRTLRDLRPPASPQRGRDSLYRLSIPFVDWCLGCRRTIEIPHFPRCEPCSGRGVVTSGAVEVCAACDGAGAIWRPGVVLGRFARCGACGGRGLLGLSACIACDGSGRTEERTSLDVAIPAGFSVRRRLRVRGLGQAGRHGGADGDLVVALDVEPDPIFVIDGHDLRAVVPIPLPRLICGGLTRVPTLEGPKSVDISPLGGVRHFVRLRGEGVRSAPPGDLILELVAEWPATLDPEQRAAAFALARAFDDDAFPGYRRALASAGTPRAQATDRPGADQPISLTATGATPDDAASDREMASTDGDGGDD
ncbi:MAG: J domain-containing protein [Myxococcales bacterium]|nr:J domain-containing protein [Myxococcales bacterium]